jgi:hypothetical protein
MKRLPIVLLTVATLTALTGCNIFAPHEYIFGNESAKTVTVSPGDYQRWQPFTLQPDSVQAVKVFIDFIEFTYAETKHVLPDLKDKNITFTDKPPFTFYNQSSETVTISPVDLTRYDPDGTLTYSFEADWEGFTLGPEEQQDVYTAMVTSSGNSYLDRYENVPIFDFAYEDENSVKLLGYDDPPIYIFRNLGQYFTVVNNLDSPVHGVEITSNDFSEPSIFFGNDQVNDAETGSLVDGIDSGHADTKYLTYNESDYITIKFTVGNENATYRTGDLISIRSWDDRVYIISESSREDWETVN